MLHVTTGSDINISGRVLAVGRFTQRVIYPVLHGLTAKLQF